MPAKVCKVGGVGIKHGFGCYVQYPSVQMSDNHKQRVRDGCLEKAAGPHSDIFELCP